MGQHRVHMRGHTQPEAGKKTPPKLRCLSEGKDQSTQIYLKCIPGKMLNLLAAFVQRHYGGVEAGSWGQPG